MTMTGYSIQLVIASLSCRTGSDLPNNTAAS